MLEDKLEEFSTQLESVTLDKELLEETLENLNEASRMNVGKLTDENLALKTINAEYEKPPEEGGERSDVTFIRLENEVLRLQDSIFACVVSCLAARPKLHHATDFR